MPKIPILPATSSSSASLNNLNQTNNVMLWWTEAVGSITFCWGGRFYNRGVGLRDCAPITCHQSRREKYLEIPPKLWQFNAAKAKVTLLF